MSYEGFHEVENGKQPQAQPTNAGQAASAKSIAATLPHVRQPELRPENTEAPLGEFQARFYDDFAATAASLSGCRATFERIDAALANTERERADLWRENRELRADNNVLRAANMTLREALAAATGTAKTAKPVGCEASQSGPKGNAQVTSGEPQ